MKGIAIFRGVVFLVDLSSSLNSTFQPLLQKKIEKVPTHTSSGNATVPSSVECQKRENRSHVHLQKKLRSLAKRCDRCPLRHHVPGIEQTLLKACTQTASFAKRLPEN